MLIDSNALCERLMKRHVHDGMDLEPMIALDDISLILSEMPIVKAIPIEWLEKKLHEGYHRMCVKAVLDMWQKEQEASGT